jgi:hypothetical protein
MEKQAVRPRDINRLAKWVTSIATGENDNTKPTPVQPGQRKGGLKGGAARAKNLTSKQRSEIAANAARKRWHKD